MLLATCLCNQAGALVGRLNQYPFHRHHSHHFWTSFHFISGTSRLSRQTSLSYVTIRTRIPQNWLDAQITCASCSGEKMLIAWQPPTRNCHFLLLSITSLVFLHISAGDKDSQYRVKPVCDNLDDNGRNFDDGRHIN